MMAFSSAWLWAVLLSPPKASWISQTQGHSLDENNDISKELISGKNFVNKNIEEMNYEKALFCCLKCWILKVLRGFLYRVSGDFHWNWLDFFHQIVFESANLWNNSKRPQKIKIEWYQHIYVFPNAAWTVFPMQSTWHASILPWIVYLPDSFINCIDLG